MFAQQWSWICAVQGMKKKWMSLSLVLQPTKNEAMRLVAMHMPRNLPPPSLSNEDDPVPLKWVSQAWETYSHKLSPYVFILCTLSCTFWPFFYQPGPLHIIHPFKFRSITFTLDFRSHHHFLPYVAHSCFLRDEPTTAVSVPLLATSYYIPASLHSFTGTEFHSPRLCSKHHFIQLFFILIHLCLPKPNSILLSTLFIAPRTLCSYFDFYITFFSIPLKPTLTNSSAWHVNILQ